MSCDATRRRALDALADGQDPFDEASVQAHLATGCAGCRAFVRELRELERELLLSPPVEPSPAVRERLLARALSPRSGPGAPETAGRPPTGGGGGRRWVVLAAAAGVAALCAWLAFAAGRAPLRAERDALRTQLATAHDQQGRLQEQLDELRSEQEDSDDELAELEDKVRTLEADAVEREKIVAMLRSPQVEVLAFRGTAQPDASGRVFWEWDDYYCYLHTHKLRPAAAGHVYALWLVGENGATVLAGTFEVGASADAGLWTQLPQDTPRVVRAFVTEEPAQVGAAPQGPVQLESVGRRAGRAHS